MNSSLNKTMGILTAVAIAMGTLGFGIGAGSRFAGAYLEGKPDTYAAAETDAASYDYALTAALESVSSNSVSSIFKAVRNSVVSINVTVTDVGWYNQLIEDVSSGSGVIFHEDAARIYIVTNHHVIESATSVTVSLDDWNQVKANYVGSNEQADLAVISVLKHDMTAANFGSYTIAQFADSSKVEVGDAAIAIGNALGEGKSASLGIISAVERAVNTDGNKFNAIQTDAAINPGNSGGPLVNSAGKVVGINTMKLVSAEVEGMGYAIPSNIVKATVDDILKNGSVGRPFFGIYNPITINEQMMRYYNFSKQGVYASQIYSDSTAAALGMKRGDIVISYNGKAITKVEDLNESISKTKIGESIKVEVLRNGAIVTLEGVMKALPSSTSF